MPYQPIVPDGQHLGTSHKVPGAVTGHLFDDETNELSGHAAWEWVDAPGQNYSTSYSYDPIYEPIAEESRQLTEEERELLATITAMLVVGTIRAAALATPHLQRWWKEKAIPPFTAIWKRISPRHKPDDQTANDPQRTDQDRRATSEMGTELAVFEAKFSMSRAEWEQRYLAMIAASTFKKEQIRILSNVRITDDDAYRLETKEEKRQLTSQEFSERVKMALESNPSLLNEETATELMKIFKAPKNSSQRSRRVQRKKS